MFSTTTNPSFSLFQLVCQKTKILHGLKLNQEILAKLLKRMHGPSINLLCSSDYQTTYSFCEIKHFVKQANSLLFHFQRLLLKNITCFITLVLRVLQTILFTDLMYHLWMRRYEQFYRSGYFSVMIQHGNLYFAYDSKWKITACTLVKESLSSALDV